MHDIISLSHNDLDRFGCELVLHWRFGNNITHFNTNYKDIHDQFFNIKTAINQNPPKVIIISDVSMAENRDDLIELSGYNIPIIFLDHHMYPDGWFDNLPENITYDWDKDRCGAQITYDFFKCDNENIGKIVKIINAYDLWKKKDPLFPVAFDMNKYFWEMGNQYFMEKVIENNYNLPNNYTQVIDTVKERNRKHVQGLHNKKLIHRKNNISIVFTDEALDEVVFGEMAAGSDIILVCTSYGHIKVRVKEEDSYSDDFKLKFREKLGCSKRGHLNAFPYIIPNPNFNKIMEHVNKILKIIEDLEK